MAKVAGRKNNGAWYRTNQTLITAPAAVVTALVNATEDTPEVIAAYNIIRDQAAQLGLSAEWTYASPAAWMQAIFTAGIPLDVWMGKCQYDIYIQTGANPPRYTPLIGPIMAKAAIIIRKECAKLLLFNRQIAWFANLNSPVPAGTDAAKEAAKNVPKISLTGASDKSKVSARRTRTVA